MPWTAMGVFGLDGHLAWLGGLGRRPRVTTAPGRLTAQIPPVRPRSPGAA